jgi:ABC-2 type transport system permease protein
VLFHLAQFGLALLAGIPLSLLAGSRPGWTLALLPALVALHALFVVGLALLVSALSVPYRDVIHLTEVGLLLLFWLTPVAYPLALAPPALRTLLGLSPITAFSAAYQDLLFFGRAPAGLAWLALLAATTLALALGTLVFRAQAPRFPEVL